MGVYNTNIFLRIIKKMFAIYNDIICGGGGGGVH